MLTRLASALIAASLSTHAIAQGLAWSGDAGYPFDEIGRNAVGTLTASDGYWMRTTEMGIGVYIPGHGTVTLTDPGTYWLNTAGVELARDGTGYLNIENGAEVAIRDLKLATGATGAGVGTLAVTGPGSRLDMVEVVVGEDGEGTVSVLQGGRVATARAVLGQHAGAEGAIDLIGMGSALSVADELVLGESGHGTLTIDQGGLLQTISPEFDQVVGGSDSGVGEITIRGAGSVWETGKTIVGAAGGASLTIEDGGKLRAFNDLIFANEPGSTADVVVSGEGSTLLSPSVRTFSFVDPTFPTPSSYGVYFGGAGEVNVRVDQGAHFQAGRVYVGHGRYSDAGVVFEPESDSVGGFKNVVDISGAGTRWDVENRMRVGENEPSQVNLYAGAEMRVSNELLVGPEGELNLHGGELLTFTLDADEGAFSMTGGTLDVREFLGDLMVQGGVFTNRSIGSRSWQVTGDYVQGSEAKMLFYVNAYYDLIGRYLRCHGQTQLAGGFEFVNRDYLMRPITIGRTVDFILGSITGRFDNGKVTGMTIDEDHALALMYTPDGFRVYGKATLLGDANADGEVSLLDLDALGVNFGQADAIWTMGDFNYDGRVTLLDLDLLGARFGQTIAAPADAPAVPEPTTLALLLLGAGGLLRRKTG